MTPAGTSNELDVQNEWEENTHTQTLVCRNIIAEIYMYVCTYVWSSHIALERQHQHQRQQKRRQQPERAAAEGDARAGSLSCQNIPLLNCFFLYRCPIDAGRRPGSSLSWYLLPRWDVSSNPSTVTVFFFFPRKKKNAQQVENEQIVSTQNSCCLREQTLMGQ